MQQSEETTIATDKRTRNTRMSSPVEWVGSPNKNGKSNRKGIDTDTMEAILKPLAAF